jgi:hypothetical protein
MHITQSNNTHLEASVRFLLIIPTWHGSIGRMAHPESTCCPQPPELQSNQSQEVPKAGSKPAPPCQCRNGKRHNSKNSIPLLLHSPIMPGRLYAGNSDRISHRKYCHGCTFRHFNFDIAAIPNINFDSASNTDRSAARARF